MALSGYKEFATGEVLTASDVNAYLMQAVMVFASSSARDSGIPSGKREEGMFYFLKDTNELGFFDGSSFVAFVGDGDISAVTITTSATSGLSGGASATSGAFSSTLVISPNQATSATVAGTDIVLIGDADDSNNLKKTTAQDIANLASGGASIALILALS